MGGKHITFETTITEQHQVSGLFSVILPNGQNKS